MSDNKKNRTRFAPSPTGLVHCGGIRTALYNYLYAKKYNGDFILRIEDTDQTRYVPEAEQYIIDSLNWLGLTPDEGPGIGGNYGPYKQSERLEIYKKYAFDLINSAHAYFAFDTTEELDKIRDSYKNMKKNFSYNVFTRNSMKNSFTISKEEIDKKIANGEPYVIRFKMPKDLEVKFDDEVRGSVTFNTNKLDDKVLFKSDGFPSYHLANVVDDHLMEITHVIRAEEWLPSTPLHYLLYQSFGWEKPVFCHLPLVLGPDKQKLSKRKSHKYDFPIFPLNGSYDDENGKVHVSGFKELGFDPYPVVNYMALLGFSPGNNIELMYIDQLIALFDLKKINNSGAVFDIKKMEYFNSHYLRAKDNTFLFDNYIYPSLKNKEHGYSNEDVIKIAELAKERSIFSKDIYDSVSFFFEPIIISENVVPKNKEEFSKVMNKFFLISEDQNFVWKADNIKKTFERLCEEEGFKMGKILPDLRTALTGGLSGPELSLTMEVLGKDKSIERIKNLLNRAEKELSV